MCDLALNPRLRAEMADAATKKARKEFDQQRCIDLTLTVYEQLLATRSRAGLAA